MQLAGWPGRSTARRCRTSETVHMELRQDGWSGPSAIRTSCPHCAVSIWLRPQEVKLALEPTAETHAGRYAFLCPACSRIPVQKADGQLVRRLRAWGVEVVTGQHEQLGTPGDHPETASNGPPLTHDDLLDLHELLQTDRWFDDLLDLT